MKLKIGMIISVEQEYAFRGRRWDEKGKEYILTQRNIENTIDAIKSGRKYEIINQNGAEK